MCEQSDVTKHIQTGNGNKDLGAIKMTNLKRQPDFKIDREKIQHYFWCWCFDNQFMSDILDILGNI